MEKYIVNGVELEYDTFDLDNMERLQASYDKISRVSQEIQQGGATIESLRALCDVFLDFFDDTIGEGTADKVFGKRVNVMEIISGYQCLYKTITANVEAAAKGVRIEAPTQGLAEKAPTENRAERRASLRAARP